MTGWLRCIVQEWFVIKCGRHLKKKRVKLHRKLLEQNEQYADETEFMSS